MQETIKHLPIQVIVTVQSHNLPSPTRFAKHIGVDPWLGHQQIDDYVTDFVADEWADHAAESIVKVEWIYI